MHYRLYFMSKKTGHIDRAENLQARDDREAIETAAGLGGDYPMELWENTRKVHRFETPSSAWLERVRVQKEQAKTEPATSLTDMRAKAANNPG